MAYLTINFKSYKHNLDYLAQKAGGKDRLFVVFKDNAYGHGIEEMAPLAVAIGIQQAVTKDVKEAIKIKPFFQKILILMEPHPQNALVDDRLIYTASDLNALEKFPQNTNIHLKIDTSMGRNGILPHELKLAFDLISKRELNLSGVFTHYYGADIIGSDFYVQQHIWKNVKQETKILAKKYNLNLIYHSRNSAALLRTDSMDDEYSRVGIASYGYTELDSSFGTFPLKPTLSLWAEKLNTRTLKKGEKVGYGGRFIASKDMIVSSYDIGYGDGFFRLSGEKNLSIKNGKNILGTLSMDCMSVQGDDDIICVFDNVTSVAKHFDTISYEILVKMSPFLKRVVLHQTSN